MGQSGGYAEAGRNRKRWRLGSACSGELCVLLVADGLTTQKSRFLDLAGARVELVSQVTNQ